MIVVLSGGVGGAKLVRGLARVCGQEALTVVVNTGDDLEMWGLHVSPDLDIVMYTLAGVVDESKGWGVRGDTLFCLEQMGRLGKECWFQLGDRDLATHLVRSERLRKGWTLSQVTRELCSAFGVTATLLPVSDDPVVTRIGTRECGEVDFEEYLVKRGAALTVDYVRYAGADAARPAPGVLESIRSAECVVVAPSNPIVSIGPILAVQGIRAALRETPAPVVGVSPLIRGRTVKGPADRMMAQLGYQVSACGVSSLYVDFLDGFVIDERDAGLEERVAKLGLAVHVTDTVMDSVGAAGRVAEEVLDLARRCGRG